MFTKKRILIVSGIILTMAGAVFGAVKLIRRINKNEKGCIFYGECDEDCENCDLFR